MKIFFSILLLLLPSLVAAECPIKFEQSDLKIEIEKQPRAIDAGGVHEDMDVIKISVPSHYKGVPIDAMELTKGEVAEFWFPIAFKIDTGKAVTELSGYSQSLAHLEMAIYYMDSRCIFTTQVALTPSS